MDILELSQILNCDALQAVFDLCQPQLCGLHCRRPIWHVPMVCKMGSPYLHIEEPQGQDYRGGRSQHLSARLQ